MYFMHTTIEYHFITVQRPDRSTSSECGFVPGMNQVQLSEGWYGYDSDVELGRGMYLCVVTSPYQLCGAFSLSTLMLCEQLLPRAPSAHIIIFR